jgi:hypothetical protein
LDRRDPGIIDVMVRNAPIVPYILIHASSTLLRTEGRARALEELACGVVYEMRDRSWIYLYPTANAGTSKASQAFWEVDDVEAEGPISRREYLLLQVFANPFRSLRHRRRGMIMRVGFDDFTFDSDTKELLRQEQSVPLSPKAFQLLEILIEN